MVAKVPTSDTSPTITAIQVSPSAPCAGEAIVLTCDAQDSETDVDLLAYQWDMGDGVAPWNSDSVRAREWTYYEAGEFTVQCIVSDGTGNTATAQKTITVAGPTVHKQDVAARRLDLI